MLQSHTHTANIKFQPNACSSCFKQYFPFLLGGENVHNYFVKSNASSPYFIKSITNSCCVEDTLRDTPDTLSFTRSFMINTRPLVECLEKSDRKVKQFRVTLWIASRRLVYCSLIECVWFCNVTPDLYRKTVTQQTLR